VEKVSWFWPNNMMVTIFRDAPDIRPDNPAFFDIRYSAGLICYQK
jgi:hypothetical protein